MAELDSGSLGDMVGTFTTHIVHADSMSKYATLDRNIEALNQGNFNWETSISLIGMEERLRLKMNLPKAILMPLQPILISQATLKMNMDVSSHHESSSQKDSEEEVSGKVSVGAGFLKASMSVKAKLGQHSSKKRSTDNRSSCEAEVVMEQGETPEGVSRLLDASLDLVDRGMDANMSLIALEETKLRAKLTSGDGFNGDDFDNGGSGNGGSESAGSESGGDGSFEKAA